MTLRRGLVLYAGGRHDQDRNFGGTTNPRLALVFNPDPRSDVKVIFGRAFRAPNGYELFYDDHASQEGNPDLRPETITTAEVDLEREVATRLRLATSLFTYRIRDLIREDTDAADDRIIYRNSDRIRSSGFEVELATERLRFLDGRLGYSYQISRNDLTGQNLVNSPRHMVKLDLRLPQMGKRLQLGTEVQYTSGRQTLAGRLDRAQVTANATLQVRLPWPGLNATASVYNLFNERWGDPGGEEHSQDILPRVGRRVLFGLRYSL